MEKKVFQEKITKESTWNTGTPSQVALKMPLYGLEAGHFYAESDYNVERDYHDSCLILLTLKGMGIVNGTTLNEGHAVIIDCHKPHHYHASSMGWEFLWLHYGGTFSDSFFELMPKDGPLTVKVGGRFKELMGFVIDSFYMQNTLNLIEISSSIQTLLAIYLEALMNTNEPPMLKENMNEAIRFIHEHYSESISVDDISSYVNLSKYHFIRSFKRNTGVTPYAYLINYRITCAKRMLVETNLSVEAVALASGFLDTANFISKFRQHTGLSPLKYRSTSSFMA